MSDVPSTRTPGLRVVALAYGLALGAALGVGAILPAQESPLAVVLVADLVGTLVVFAFSRIHDNSSLYDPYWSVVPPVIVAYFWLLPGLAPEPRRTVVAVLVLAWSLRLTWNWLRGWRGLDHEDWRYRDLREKSGRAYWLVSFLGIHLFPTGLVLLGCQPLLPALTGGRELGALDVVAGATTSIGLLIEGIADQQLRSFVRTRPAATDILDRGLWALSRHPNYFGEILFWWGLALFGLAGGGGGRVVLGASAITLLFLFVSLPLIEERMASRRPAWPEHRRRVSLLVPWFPAARGRKSAR